MKRSFTTRAVIVTLIASVCFVGMPAPKAHAILGASFEINPAVVSGVVATGVSTSFQTVILNQLNGLAWTVAKIAVASITRSTVNWINSGFQGSPAFATDLQTNLNALSDTVANNFFNQLNKTATDVTGFNLKSPFQDQINQKLRADYYKSTGNLLGLNQYDLQGHTTNPTAFLNGDFSKGGLNGFFSASQNPANNPFGAYMQASNAMFSQIDAAAKNRRDEFTAGRGFLSFRGTCGSSVVAKTSSGTSLAQKDGTYGCPIKTPGAVIEQQLENNLGSGVRQLELADSINEIVGALLGQLVNHVLGTGGLSGASQPSVGGGSSYIDQAAAGVSAPSSLTTGVAQTIANDIVDLGYYRDHWQLILDTATAAQKACGDRADITGAIATSTANVQRGNVALAQETAVSTAFMQAAQSTSADSSTQLTAAITQYQTYISGPTALTKADFTDAETQSSDTSSSTTTPQSLYSQLVQEGNACGDKSIGTL